MSLLTGLTAYYPLSDTSDASGGGNTLTNHGTVTFGAGKVGNAATFLSSSGQWLSHSDTSAYQMGTGDFSFMFWFKTISSGSFMQLINYGGRAASPSIYVEMSGTFLTGSIIDDASHTLSLSSGSFAYADGNWHLYIVTVARAGNYKLIIDNSTIINASAASLTASMHASADFGVGLGAGEDGANKYDGSLDEVGIWSRALDGTETAALWNGGAGLPFSSFAPTVTVNLTGVAADPQVGTGTVGIGSVAVTSPSLVAGGGHRASWDWWPNIQKERVLLKGVAARPRIGNGTAHALLTLREIEELYPFPKVPSEPKRIPPLVVREPAKPPPPPYMVSVGLKGAQPMTVIGTGRVKIVAELSEYELMMLAAMDNL